MKNPLLDARERSFWLWEKRRHKPLIIHEMAPKEILAKELFHVVQ